jgi:hypothetical protein
LRELSAELLSGAVLLMILFLNSSSKLILFTDEHDYGLRGDLHQ